MYLPIFLPWAKQPTPHTPPPCLLPRQCEERPGVKCKRENAVVQTVPTTSVSLSLPPSCSWFLPATLHQVCLLLCFSCHLSFSRSSLSLPSLSFSQVGCCFRLQVRRTPQPMKNECRRTPWLWWTSPYVGLSLFSVWLPPEKCPATHTYTHTHGACTHTSSKRSGPNICLVERRGCARVAQTHGQEGLFVYVCVYSRNT